MESGLGTRLARSKHELTLAQRRIYNALVRCTEDGWPASVREVQREVGHASPSTTQHQLCTLECLGWAMRHPRREAGGWMPLDP